jgi:hypothetical protein
LPPSPLLDAVALRWGVEQSRGGKTVWCELHCGTDGFVADPETFQVPLTAHSPQIDVSAATTAPVIGGGHHNPSSTIDQEEAS